MAPRSCIHGVTSTYLPPLSVKREGPYLDVPSRSLLPVANSLFLVLFGLLCFHNRIAIDDFYFLALANKYGPVEATIVEHSAWSARWCSVLLNQVVLTFQGSRWNLFLFGIGALLLFVVAVKRIIGRSAVSIAGLHLDRWSSWNIS